METISLRFSPPSQRVGYGCRVLITGVPMMLSVCICGNSIRNVVPTPMSLSTQMCPSIFEITDMTLANPSPPFPGVLWCRAVQNFRKGFLGNATSRIAYGDADRAVRADLRFEGSRAADLDGLNAVRDQIDEDAAIHRDFLHGRLVVVVFHDGDIL